MTEPRVLIHHCQLAVAVETGVTLAQQRGTTKRAAIARPRQMAMALACELTSRSTVQIGQNFNRDHSTVVHARDRIAAMLADPDHADLAFVYRRCRGRAIAEAGC